MGRKKLVGRDISEMSQILIGMFVPENILFDFEPWDIYGKQGQWTIELREKEIRIPKDLLAKNSDIVLDGFCNPIDMLSFGFSLGPVNLRIYRRRWKLSNEDEHFSNEYNLHLEGFKIVPELGIFLKEEDRRFTD